MPETIVIKFSTFSMGDMWHAHPIDSHLEDLFFGCGDTQEVAAESFKQQVAAIVNGSDRLFSELPEAIEVAKWLQEKTIEFVEVGS